MINLGLNRISQLLTHLPSPQTWTAIHIAGTNGKGSVAAYISSLFRRLANTPGSEIKVGKFTSPHLIDRWDCITINDTPVSQSLFLSVEKQIQKLASKVETDPVSDNKVTEFELLTATAFEIFSQQKCQIAVIECGLGGRLDATNAMNASKVAICVITKIGLDHQGLLGHTIAEIAREKAGIAKPGIPMIFDGSNPISVKEAIRTESKRLRSGQVFESTIYEATTESPLATHQQQNLSLALQAYNIASKRIPGLNFLDIDHMPNTINQMLADAQSCYPGRLQHLSLKPLFPAMDSKIFLDGAHNPQSATVLREYIDQHQPGATTWVLGMSRGKDLSQIMSIILRPGDRVVTCAFGPVDGMPWVRHVDPRELADAARKVVGEEQVEMTPDVVAALEIAVRDSERNTVVAGSLYLVSDLLRALRDGPEAVRVRISRRRNS